jgi:SNF2 family DNA or RNA helicase
MAVHLHAAWLPGAETPGGAFFLWGDDARSPGPGTPVSLSGVVPPKELLPLVGRLSGGVLHECAEEETIRLPWPTRRGRPLPHGAAITAGDGTRLGDWPVRGLLVPPGDVLPFLAGLPREAPPGLQYGGSLRFWMECGSLALGLLARQRLVPMVAVTHGPEGRERLAAWRPVLADPEDRQALELLSHAMPGICRAAAATREAGGRFLLPDPATVVRDFLATTMDASARFVLAEEGFPDRGGRRSDAIRALTGPIGSWLRALGWIEGKLEGDSRNLDEFTESVRRWGEVLHEPAPGSYRTTFRLVEPPLAPAPPAAGEPSSTEDSSPAADVVTPSQQDGFEWNLEFLLQNRARPERLISAAGVWEAGSPAMVWDDCVLERPQDRLLGDLGRASRLFQPLERALEGTRPSACPLSAAEAHTFLRKAASLLEESGFGVIVPKWWGEPASRPRLRLRLRPAGWPSRGPNGISGGGQVDSIGTSADRPASDTDPAVEAGPPLGPAALVAYDWEIALGDAILAPDEFQRLAREQRPLVLVRGRWVELDPERTESIRQVMNDGNGTRELTLAEAVRWSTVGPDPLAEESAPEVIADGWIADLLDRLRGHRVPEMIETDERFVGTLRPYQSRGVGWLEFLRRCGLGACLADDMGLGKTVQMIALLLRERTPGAPPVGPTLVLCPMSVVGNWQREIERFAPSLRTMVHHGLHRRRDHTFAEEAAENDAVVTTYALAHRDRAQLRTVAWERIVLDEAQNLKNPVTLQARAVRAMRANTRVALTGTPLENRLSELWSILDTLNPGYLGTRADFRRRYSIPIERNRDPRRREGLRRLVQPFLLRRLKTDPDVIRDLPEKLEMVVYCNLTREQAALYQAVLDEMLGAVERSSGIARRGLILAVLTRLKQVCNHPSHYLRDGGPIEGRSGKTARLAEMMEEVLAVGERALIFTQFTEMGHLLRAFLAERLRTEVMFLHGGTPKGERDRMVDRFAAPDGPRVFLLSLRAGGTGLNLTPATHVFHFDRWWNPAVEDQATDRAFRIGQTRRVQVHKYVCVGTLEERIDKMIRDKRELANLVVGAGEDWLTELDTGQLRDVLRLSRDAVSED